MKYAIGRSATRPTAAILCCIGVITAQDRTQTFRAQTKVVQVPVIVTGKDGRNVDDLTAGDFRVLDNGVAQPLKARLSKRRLRP